MTPNVLLNVVALAAASLSGASALPFVHWPAWLVAVAAAIGSATAKYARPLADVPRGWSPLVDMLWVSGLGFSTMAATPALTIPGWLHGTVAVVGIFCAKMAPAPIDHDAEPPPPRAPPGPLAAA